MLSYLGWALDRIIFLGGGGVWGCRRGFQPKRLLETRGLDRINLKKPRKTGVLPPSGGLSYLKRGPQIG